MVTLGVFLFSWFLHGLVIAALAVLNFWIWQKTKANSNLLMLIGSGLTALVYILGGVGMEFGGDWLAVIGTAIFVAGFYLSVKPMVAAQLATMKAKIQQAGQKASGGGAGGNTGT